MRVLYANQYDFMFLFDHTSGYTKKHENSKDASAMNKFHGGRSQKPTLVEEAKQIFGPHHDPENKLMAQVGSVQVLNWVDSVDPATEGPIYLSLSERVRQ